MNYSPDQLSKIIIGKAIKVHKALGPGLLESAYQKCLAYELRKTGLYVEEEKPVPLIYEEVEIECSYRMDIFVENKFVIETKSIEELAPIHLAQILTYLRLTETSVGLLLNFNVLKMADGIKRVVFNYQP